MNEIFYSYFSYFLHPFKVNSYFREKREAFIGKGIPFLVDQEIMEDREILDLDLSEILVISWVFFIIHSFYSIFFVNIANLLVDLFNVGSIINPSMIIYTTLAQVVLFPLIFWAYAKVWKILIEFFANLFTESEEDFGDLSDQVVNVSLSSYVFLLIPIIGGAVRHLAFLIYIFGGLRKNLGLSIPKAFIVILSPIFFLGFLAFMFILLIATILVSF